MIHQFKNFFRVFTATAYYLLIAFPLVVSAAQVTLQWDAGSPVPDGYNLYQHAQGQAYDYSAPVNSSGITGTTYTVSGLTEGSTYYFVLRAFVGSSESGDSNEVSYTVPVTVADSDNDGYNDSVDAFPNDSSEWLDTDGDGVGNNADNDDDGDGMLDAWEILYGLDPMDSSDAAGDLDGDGVTNLAEYNNGTDPSQVPGNTAPNQPVLAMPADGALDVDLMPTLMTEAFADIDGDAHDRTHYQIATSTDWSADLVFEGEFTTYLTSITLGDLILDPETTYYWRVRFYDDHNGESAWSAPSSFTTIDSLTAGLADDDGDGILNEQEVAPADVIPELNIAPQTVVIGTPDATNPQLGVLLSTNANIISLRAVAADLVEVGSIANRPQVLTGLISFKLGLLSGETSADVTVYLTEPAPDGAMWYKYDLEQGWVPFSNVTFAGDRKSVTIHLTDGGVGDDDGV
ncbi:MAG: fibronectin type III domain-containing protein, partial [Desulfobacterales bacterium]